MEQHPIRILPSSRNSSSYSSSGSAPLFGWLLSASSTIGGRLCSRCLIFLFNFSPSNSHLIWWYDAPHALQPSRASSLILLLPQTSTFGCLLCLSFKFQPLKAKAPFSLYFSLCVVLHSPNKPTNGGAPKPDGECLACNHREWRHHHLLLTLTYS